MGDWFGILDVKMQSRYRCMRESRPTGASPSGFRLGNETKTLAILYMINVFQE